MPNSITQSTEDYLKAIYELADDKGRVSTNLLANYLRVSPASVTGMIKKLSQTSPPFLNYQKHRGVSLTADGEKIALSTLRHHRLLEVFLHEILGFPWDEVHEEADKLEHVISKKFEERMTTLLGDPKYDPHGSPIPSKELKINKSSMACLNDLRPNQKAILKRVNDKDPKLLRHLSDLGLKLGSEIHIRDYSPFDENTFLTLKASTKPIVLGAMITKQIHVEVIDE